MLALGSAGSILTGAAALLGIHLIVPAASRASSAAPFAVASPSEPLQTQAVTQPSSTPGPAELTAELAAEDQGFVDKNAGVGWGNRCFTHYKAGRLMNAKAACERGLATSEASLSTRGAIFYNMGLIAQKSGNTQAAKHHYEESLRVRPGNAVVQKALAALSSLAPQTGSSLRSKMKSFAASSFISNGWNQHAPDKAFDDDPATAWNEYAEGPGKGEWLEVTFNSAVNVDAIEMTTGWDHVMKDGTDRFMANARLRRFRIELSEGAALERDVGETQRSVRVDLAGRRTTRIKIVALEVYPGQRFQDLCISDVKVLESGTAPR